MKRTSAKVISISDLIQWHQKGELELSPKYQRNSVWNEKAKSYLIDTIIRGLPIPPIFLRQTVDVNTKKTYREIIDGQQRVRSIIEFIVEESFSIKKSHNKELGGKLYSDLEEDIQESLLEYEILSEVVAEKDESVVYDMFARLNSNNIVLNKQEVRNSKYWGEFKVFIFELSSRYREFFMEKKLLDDKDCSRMKDSELVNSMVILMSEGVVGETPKYVDSVYLKYDIEFKNADLLEKQFARTMLVLESIYDYLNGSYGCFSNKNYFFTLFAVIYHQMFGISNVDGKLIRLEKFSDDKIIGNIALIEKLISEFIIDYENNIADKDNLLGNYADYNRFAKCHSSRTTSKLERLERIGFLNLALERYMENE